MNYLISRNSLLAAFALMFIATVLSLCLGYFIGTLEPREPTFAEKIYHNIDMKKQDSCMKRCVRS